MADFPERLVYVDDELDMRTIVRETLESNGFDGAFAACGSAKELLNRWAVLQPEMILLDLKMPDMSGLDLIEAIFQDPEKNNIPIVFVTGAIKVEMLEKYKKLGVIGVIHKPFDLGKLTDLITDLWAKRKENLEPEPEAEEGSD
ncbi:MAG: response regulator [Pseudomonadota bacterium]